MNATTEEMYRAKVGSGPDCWEWTGSLLNTGYGIFYVKRQRMLAHRVSYEMAHGPIPAGLFVCHHCDNRKCTRPDHLFLGTHGDNMADAERKGRLYRNCGDRMKLTAAGRQRMADAVRRKKAADPTHNQGERNPAARLTAEQVRDIRAVFATGSTTKQALADRFGVARTTIYEVVSGRTWAA